MQESTQDLRTCTKCGQTKDITQFSYKLKSKNIRQTICKKCFRQSAAMRLRQTYHRNKDYVNNLKKSGCCQKCGQKRYYLLQYHHVNKQEKEYNVSKLLSNASFDRILSEIDKCILLCCNCHRQFHYFQLKDNINIQQYLSCDVTPPGGGLSLEN